MMLLIYWNSETWQSFNLYGSRSLVTLGIIRELLEELFITYRRQLSCHNRLLKGFRSSRGRSSTPRLLWSTQSPGCAYKRHSDDRNTNLEVRL